MMSRRAGRALGLALLCFSPYPVLADTASSQASAEEASLADAKAWFAKMAQAFHALSYDASFIYVHDGRIESMRLVHAVSEGRERERLIHLNGPAREVLRDGEAVVRIVPEGEGDDIPAADLHRANITGLFTVDAEKLFPYYDFELKDEVRVAGRMGQYILVRSKDGYRYGYRLVLDKQTGLLLRSDLTDERGQIIEQIQVISLNVRDSIPESELLAETVGKSLPESQPTPASTTVVDPGWEVGWLPQGFSLSGYKQQAKTGTTTDHMMFSDGLTSISVYVQDPGRDGGGADVMRKGGTTAYDVARDGYRVTVVGEVPVVTAQKIADSVRRVVTAPASRKG